MRELDKSEIPDFPTLCMVTGIIPVTVVFQRKVIKPREFPRRQKKTQEAKEILSTGSIFAAEVAFFCFSGIFLERGRIVLPL